MTCTRKTHRLNKRIQGCRFVYFKTNMEESCSTRDSIVRVVGKEDQNYYYSVQIKVWQKGDESQVSLRYKVQTDYSVPVYWVRPTHSVGVLSQQVEHLPLGPQPPPIKTVVLHSRTDFYFSRFQTHLLSSPLVILLCLRTVMGFGRQGLIRDKDLNQVTVNVSCVRLLILGLVI